MTQKRILFFFILAGLILAAVLGFYFYHANLGPGRDEVNVLLTNFTENIAAGKLNNARNLMTEETRAFLRDPGTSLGEAVYKNLRLKSVENIYSEGNSIYTADVILSTLDTLKILAKAGLMFEEQDAKEETAEEEDLAIADIYNEILSRDDLPVIDNFCVIRMEMKNGQLFIIGDTALQNILEGNLPIPQQP